VVSIELATAKASALFAGEPVIGMAKVEASPCSWVAGSEEQAAMSVARNAAERARRFSFGFDSEVEMERRLRRSNISCFPSRASVIAKCRQIHNPKVLNFLDEMGRPVLRVQNFERKEPASWQA
jgi:hypothetical protein